MKAANQAAGAVYEVCFVVGLMLAAVVAGSGCGKHEATSASGDARHDPPVPVPTVTNQPAQTAQAKASEVPTIFHTVDLTEHFDRLLSSYKPDESWGKPARGQQTFDGVPFFVEGKMELTGLGAARNGRFWPARVVDIPVHGKAHHLHLLHGAGYADADGTPMAKLVVNYADGSKVSRVIAYGVHSRNWYVEREELLPDVEDPDSKIAWSGSLGSNGPKLRLFKTSFALPNPSREIQSIDLYSLFSRATPFVVAITVEDGGSAQVESSTVVPSASDFDDSPFRRELTIRIASEKTGQPIPGATVTVTAREPRRQFAFGNYKAGARAQVTLDYPPHRFDALQVQVQASGHPPAALEIQSVGDGMFEEQHLVKLQPE